MAVDRQAVGEIFARLKAEGRTALTAPEGQLVCQAYGIPVPREALATSPAEAARLAAELGFPVVMKIVSPRILHKTDAGGVVVGVAVAWVTSGPHAGAAFRGRLPWQTEEERV